MNNSLVHKLFINKYLSKIANTDDCAIAKERASLAFTEYWKGP